VLPKNKRRGIGAKKWLKMQAESVPHCTAEVQEEFGFTIAAVAEVHHGMVWKATGTHGLVHSRNKGKGATEDAVMCLLRDMAEGIEPCEQENCDICLDEKGR